MLGQGTFDEAHSNLLQTHGLTYHKDPVTPPSIRIPVARRPRTPAHWTILPPIGRRGRAGLHQPSK